MSTPEKLEKFKVEVVKLLPNYDMSRWTDNELQKWCVLFFIFNKKLRTNFFLLFLEFNRNQEKFSMQEVFGLIMLKQALKTLNKGYIFSGRSVYTHPPFSFLFPYLHLSTIFIKQPKII